MKKCLLFMLVIVLASCTKDTITPIPDTQLEGLKGKVKSREVTSSNMFFGFAGKRVSTYNEDGYKVYEEAFIDGTKTGEYTVLFKINYKPYQNSSRSIETYVPDENRYITVTNQWLTDTSYISIIEPDGVYSSNKKEVKVDEKGREVYLEINEEYVDKNRGSFRNRRIFEYDEKGYKVMEKESDNEEPYSEVKVVNLTFDKEGNVTKQKKVSEDIDANYEVEYTYEYYQ
ncbi:hypothetical protein ACF8C4_00505 [Myroides odoratimimus]|uniref:hypothetical protein n=1 Tax=Myroides TaxID=76831 RepID=UPI0003546BB7|nr:MULTISPECIES: hypothetical protein [Myroides]AJA67836.1 hypothetical protein MYRA21_0644 [Myroides sp. A21]EPH08358.1 hypothetical protein HMPREF9713_03314 [Myroides odoratimimus CCUG 12700]MDM1498348.1 hypothetical protein [Myroides odoratimimus]MDM1509520.1 hypothetical protein [Myroides odoratimimus]MDM1511513.1 hypothetical protein [Myroides odoratimimus]